MGQDIEKLLSAIRRYLDESDWYIFKYEDYFTLRALFILSRKRIYTYIDNTMESGDYSVYITRMGVTFLHEFGIRFDQRFRKDFSMVNIEYIEIPETEESMECAGSLQNVFI